MRKFFGMTFLLAALCFCFSFHAAEAGVLLGTRAWDTTSIGSEGERDTYIENYYGLNRYGLTVYRMPDYTVAIDGLDIRRGYIRIQEIARNQSGNMYGLHVGSPESAINSAGLGSADDVHSVRGWLGRPMEQVAIFYTWRFGDGSKAQIITLNGSVYAVTA